MAKLLSYIGELLSCLEEGYTLPEAMYQARQYAYGRKRKR